MNIGQGFNQDIAYRSKPGQADEYYSQKTGQTFGDPASLSKYINSTYQGANSTPDNVFGVLQSGYTPRADALNQIKDQLNQFQNDTFNSTDPTAKRASSSLADSIASDQSSYDTDLANYRALTDKLAALTAPDYEKAFSDLRASQGVPGLETDYANNQKNIRELPYVNRMNSGNAGVETEGQLGADTSEKGIPLEIQQGNLLDRLNLANDFINTSLNLKEKNYTTSQDSLKNAADLLGNTINLTRTHLSDLSTLQQQQQAQQKAAQQFAYDNRISTPFYEVGGTIYRTSDQKAYSTPEQFFADGGAQDFKNVQSVSAPKYTSQNIIGNETSGYFYLDPQTGKKTPVLPGTGSTQFSVVGKDASGNDIYGFVDPTSKAVTPINANGGSFPAGAQKPGSAAAVNDPLGIKPSGHFQQFSTPDEGFQAGVQLIQRYQSGSGPKGINANSSLNQFVNTWITGNPNNTQKTGYNANDIAGYLQQFGIQANANTPIGQIDSSALAAAVAKAETGYTASSKSSPLANAPGYDSNGKKYTPATGAQEILNEWKGGYIQGNGTISSNDYKTAKSWWVQEGLSASDFDNAFNYLIDKSGKNWAFDYGLSNTSK